MVLAALVALVLVGSNPEASLVSVGSMVGIRILVVGTQLAGMLDMAALGRVLWTCVCLRAVELQSMASVMDAAAAVAVAVAVVAVAVGMMAVRSKKGALSMDVVVADTRMTTFLPAVVEKHDVVELELSFEGTLSFRDAD